MTAQVYVAFYKGRAKNAKQLKEHMLDSIIRLATLGQYSHCEMAIDLQDGTFHCFSSSPRDGGVRDKIMPLPSDRWDLIPVDLTVAEVQAFYQQLEGSRYDWQGIGVFLLPFVRHLQSKSRWFCSEYCATNLKLDKPHRYSPNSLAQHLKQSK